MHEYSAAVLRTEFYSNEVFIDIEVIVLASSVANDVVNVELVA
jgi:hypothetical protein